MQRQLYGKVAIILSFSALSACSFAGPYVTNISPAGEQGILVEKCKVQLNPMTNKVSTGDCNTSYVWLGGEKKGKVSEDWTNPNNNVITIK
jgi:hypothetical protein